MASSDKNWKLHAKIIRGSILLLCVVNMVLVWGVIYAGEYCWNYHGKKIYDFDTARLVAFNLFDEMYNSRREAQPYWDDDRWIYQE